MKVVIAPDSFKESLPADEVARAIQAGFQSIFPQAEYHLLPIADGGEGTVKALVSAHKGRMESIFVTGPLGIPVEAKIAFSNEGKTAFIEMAEACGLHLVPIDRRNPLHTTSFGVGELMLHALNQGAAELIIGVGGSSTNDGGVGMASALGYEFFDEQGKTVKGNGKDLFRITSMSDRNRNRRLDSVKITVAADVDNPLTGNNGATYIYGPQKGLPKEMLNEMDHAMGRFYQIAGSFMKVDVSSLPGSGAGGGMGAGLLLFTGAQLKKGIDLVLEQLKVKEICQDADIVIVGEGKIDGQTIFGKAPAGVAKCAPRKAKVIAICGSVGEGSEALYNHGFTAIFPTIPAMLPIEHILSGAFANIERTSRNVAALLRNERDGFNG
ncbi:glycerate kinase [Peribacillus muralis]|uniref:Glycerate kinase n=1 Tax=Peribacillus muralis TaxID=264697 RepID=A0A1B3XLA9_9BACI|nr:glycerate kinase [Peribacillus muralis]AOH53990.1 glycerate kinase [Peribacillus muralis]